MKDPNRLRDEPDLPDVLHGALRALGNQAPSTETVARVHRTLSSLPAASGSFMGLSTGWLRTGAYVTSAAAVSILAVATWTRFPPRVERDVEAPILRHNQVQEPDSRPPEAAKSTLPSVAPSIPGSVALSPRTSKVPLASASTSQSRSRAAKRHKFNHTSSSSSAQAESSSGPSFDAPASSYVAAAETPSEAAVAAAVEPTGQTSDEAQAQAATPVAARAPVPEDEALLMYRAKKSARTDRGAAWRMLEQHRIHFPTGNLAEEREVLAIDLLRRMGRSREANQRAALFVEQYPRSSYRSAIQRR